MTATKTTDVSRRCPSAEVLLRYGDKHLSQAEADRVANHVKDCPHCRADVESVEFLEAEVLMAQADRAALAKFKPDRAHARVCWNLKDQLPAISRAPVPPRDDVLAHLD